MVAVEEPNHVEGASNMNPRFLSPDQFNRNNQKQCIDLSVFICLSLEFIDGHVYKNLTFTKKKCKSKIILCSLQKCFKLCLCSS